MSRCITTRQVIGRITLSLILGAITTIAVAWGCAISFDHLNSSQIEQKQYRLRLGREGGWECFVSDNRYFGGRVAMGIVDPPQDGFIWPIAAEIRTEHDPLLKPILRDLRNVEMWEFLAFGLPFRCVHAGRAGPDNIFNPAGWDLEGAINLSGPRIGRRYLPYRIYPIGFTLNVLVWALAWFVLLLTIHTIRIRFRRRCNRCERCAYSLEGITSDQCPECGSAIMAAGRSATQGRSA